MHRLPIRLIATLVLVATGAAPALAETTWEQEDQYSGVATLPDDVFRFGATGDEVDMLDTDGNVRLTFPLDLEHLDMRDGWILGGGRTLTVFDTDGLVKAEIVWPAPPAPQITDVAVSGSTAVVAVNGGVRLFDLETLAPKGALVPADPGRDIRLGAGQDVLLVAFYPKLPAPHPGYATTDVQVFENLTLSRTVTLTHFRRESARVPPDLVPLTGGWILVAHEWMSTPVQFSRDLYRPNGSTMDQILDGLDGDLAQVALSTDMWVGVIGSVTFQGIPGSQGFKFVDTIRRDKGCFLDTSTDIFRSAIEWLGRKGITTGCNEFGDRYCPVRSVTRGEMAAFLVRAPGYTDNGGGGFFADTAESVFEGVIDKLAAAGVTKGCNPPVNDRYCPSRPVTRGEMAAFVVRAYGFTDSGTGDYFTDDDGSVFEGAIDRLRAAGVTLGCNPPANDRFCPNRRVSRGEMAAFIKRATEA